MASNDDSGSYDDGSGWCLVIIIMMMIGNSVGGCND